MTKRAITLMGMSGVGKTTFSMKLAEWGWASYSCDVDIGKDLLGLDRAPSPEDISALSDFIGMIGDESKGGLPLAEFKRRQTLYVTSEMAAMRRLEELVPASAGDFVCDSTGSLCEITDQDVIDCVGRHTKIVYIRGSDAQKQALIERAVAYPKPLYYPPALLDGWIADFVAQEGLDGPAQMAPKAFARWVFPRLLDARLPKYQRIADAHGVTIESADLEKVDSLPAFLELIGEK